MDRERSPQGRTLRVFCQILETPEYQAWVKTPDPNQSDRFEYVRLVAETILGVDNLGWETALNTGPLSSVLIILDQNAIEGRKLCGNPEVLDTNMKSLAEDWLRQHPLDPHNPSARAIAETGLSALLLDHAIFAFAIYYRTIPRSNRD